jgi:hypothetical protein
MVGVLAVLLYLLNNCYSVCYTKRNLKNQPEECLLRFELCFIQQIVIKSNFAKDGGLQEGQEERLEHLLRVVEKEKSMNKRNFDQPKTTISNLKDKIPVSPTVACDVEEPQPSGNRFVPATLALSARVGGCRWYALLLALLLVHTQLALCGA